MTKQEAKDLSLEVWRYLAKHPEIKHKFELPSWLYQKIVGMCFECPLCEVHKKSCSRCPLGDGKRCCLDPGQPYLRWFIAETSKGRQEAAEEIVRLVGVWDTGASVRRRKKEVAVDNN